MLPSKIYTTPVHSRGVGSPGRVSLETVKHYIQITIFYEVEVAERQKVRVLWHSYM